MVIDAQGDLANAYTVRMIESKMSCESYQEWLKSENAVEAPKDASSVDDSMKVSKFDKLFQVNKWLQESRRGM